MIIMFSFMSGYYLWRMYLSYGIWAMDLTTIVMNQTTKVTFLAWSISDYYVKEHVETQMKLVKWVCQKNNSKFDGYGQVSSSKASLEKNITKITKEFKLDQKTLLAELKNVSLEPELFREQLLANLPKINYKDTSKMSEKDAKIQQGLDREIEEEKLQTMGNLPTILEYMSYNFCFIGSVGPMVSYNDFYDFIYHRNNYQDTKVIAKQISIDVYNMIFFHLVYLSISPYFPMGYIASDDYENSSNIYFLLWFVIGCTVLRFKYYLAFSVGQLTANLSGISWNSKKKDMSRYQNIDFWGVEWDQRAMLRMKSWNISVQSWLEQIVYNRCWYKKSIDIEFWKLRFTIPFSKSRAVASVFVFSAAWHGFYIGFYHIFFYWFILRELQRAGYSNKDTLSKLPTWPLPKFITGSDNDYAYVRNVQEKLEKRIPFFPNYKWDWLPLIFDPWMIITQVYYFT